MTDAAIDELRRELERIADPIKAPQMAAYMKDQFPYFGISAGDRRAASRPYIALGKGLDADAVLNLAESCYEQHEREFHYVATDLLRRWAAALGGHEDLARVERLIRTDSWWDTVDALAVHTVGPMVAADPALVEVMDRWITDDDIWIARTAILFQLNDKDRTDADRLFGYIDQRASDTDFFIRKAAGWALRQYARTDPDAVADYVDDRGDLLSGLTRREALKHIAR